MCPYVLSQTTMIDMSTNGMLSNVSVSISRLNNKKRYNKHLILIRMHFLLTFSSFFFLSYFFLFFFFRSKSLSEVLKYTRCLEIHTFSRSKGRFHPEILTKALSCHDMYILIEINLSCNNVSLDSQMIP
jgi:hypothetical protein